MDWTTIVNYDEFKNVWEKKSGLYLNETWRWLLDECEEHLNGIGFGNNETDKGESAICYIERFSAKKRKYVLFYVEFLCVEPTKWSEPDEDGDVELEENAIYEFIDIWGDVNDEKDF